jgi:uroporphyrinogen III methyltransferase / synthase
VGCPRAHRVAAGTLVRWRRSGARPVDSTRRGPPYPLVVTVYLVGAGPGDPGLLTVRGDEVLRRADVVVFDRLSVASLLDLAPPGAERINVGKTPGHATVPQEQINALLVEHGRRSRTVVRLKGGDPFVFARGGEEAAALVDAGIPFEVVPGITSAIGVPAYAGIPVTMRHSSELFTVITGHEDPDKGGELDWETVARLGGTIVILMGVGRLPKIVARLRAGGLGADTPVAAIRWGTRPEQHTIRATLGTVLDRLDEIRSPSTIVVGRVAGLQLDWFESRPLFGTEVVVTRTRSQASQLSAALRSHGASTVEVPVIEIGEPADGGAALRAAASRAGTYDWIVLTSPNGAEQFVSCLRDGRDLGGARLAAIGPGTADALARCHLVADLVPERFVAEGLLEALLAEQDGAPARALLPRAAIARDVLPDGLREHGWEVEVVEAYRTRPVVPTDDQRAAVSAADVVTFTSSSTVTNFIDAFGIESLPPLVACIGPVTAATARSLGIEPDVEAAEHTIDGLVAALVANAST